MQHLSSRILAALFAFFLPLAVVSSWTLATVSSTDRWVATLHPLASNQVVTTYIANEGAATIVRDLKVEHRIVSALPTAAGILAPTLTNALQQTIASALARALESQAFQRLWDEENRLTHGAVVAILDGRTSRQLSRGQSVVLDVTPIVVAALDQLNASHVSFLKPLEQQLSHQGTLSLPILDVREIHQAQRYYHLATSLWWLFPLLSVVSGVGVVVISRPCRNGLIRLGLVAGISSLVAYALLSIGVATASTRAPTPTTVTSTILHTVTSSLAARFLWGAVVGAMLVGLGWLFGPSAYADATRRNLRHTQRWIGCALRRRTSDLGTADWHQWLTSHRRHLARDVRVADVVVAVGSSLLLWRGVTTLWQLVTLIVFVVGWYWLAARLRHTLTSDSR